MATPGNARISDFRLFNGATQYDVQTATVHNVTADVAISVPANSSATLRTFAQSTATIAVPANANQVAKYRNQSAATIAVPATANQVAKYRGQATPAFSLGANSNAVAKYVANALVSLVMNANGNIVGIFDFESTSSVGVVADGTAFGKFGLQGSPTISVNNLSTLILRQFMQTNATVVMNGSANQVARYRGQASPAIAATTSAVQTRRTSAQASSTIGLPADASSVAKLTGAASPSVSLTADAKTTRMLFVRADTSLGVAGSQNTGAILQTLNGSAEFVISVDGKLTRRTTVTNYDPLTTSTKVNVAAEAKLTQRKSVKASPSVGVTASGSDFVKASLKGNGGIVVTTSAKQLRKLGMSAVGRVTIGQPAIIDKTTLNGSYDVAGAGGGDIFASWAEYPLTSTISRDTTDYVGEAGGASCRFNLTSGSSPYVRHLTALTPGVKYHVTFWAKANKAGCTVNFGSGNVRVTQPITTDWTQYTAEFTADDSIFIMSTPMGSGNWIGWVDEITVMPASQLPKLSKLAGFGAEATLNVVSIANARRIAQMDAGAIVGITADQIPILKRRTMSGTPKVALTTTGAAKANLTGKATGSVGLNASGFDVVRKFLSGHAGIGSVVANTNILRVASLMGYGDITLTVDATTGKVVKRTGANASVGVNASATTVKKVTLSANANMGVSANASSGANKKNLSGSAAISIVAQGKVTLRVHMKAGANIGLLAKAFIITGYNPTVVDEYTISLDFIEDDVIDVDYVYEQLMLLKAIEDL